MSDFIYSSKSQSQGELTRHIQSIYHNDPPEVFEYHGEWGSLGVSSGHYQGFLPYENEQCLLTVIGGPVLYFQNNDFLVRKDSSAASKAIYQRWNEQDTIHWDEDLSGPFAMILVHKRTKTVEIVTDLMAFIPVYSCQKVTGLYLGTHVDALANASEEAGNFDQVSLADFVLNDVVTYPYTAYKNIRQQPPGSKITFDGAYEKSEFYWQPVEENSYKNINVAANELRQGISDYIARVTKNMTHVAQFISAGEDSRAMLGLIQSKLKRDAYIFLDKMNREGIIAKRVAEKYEVNFKVGFRDQAHYLEILKEASTLIGSGHQYKHAHALRFDKQFRMKKYDAVFGGYLADSLLKAHYSQKYRGKSRLTFLPDIFIKGEKRTIPLKACWIPNKVVDMIDQRRLEQFMTVKKYRQETAHEWFVLWPMTMRKTIPNFYSTRRLFKSYEPFMCKEVVKISASVPIEWKLNRRLFHKAMKQYMMKSKWITHTDGRLPYFNWWVNIPINLYIRFYRNMAQNFGAINGNQGPWCDWNVIFSDQNLRFSLYNCASEYNNFEFIKPSLKAEHLLHSEHLSNSQKANLLQTMYHLEKAGH